MTSSSPSSASPAKPRTFNGDLAKLPPALLPLTRLRRWVVWKWELRLSKGREKWTKPPYQPSAPERRAKANDPSTWGSYEEAILAVLAGKADGLGLMLLNSEMAAADLDHVRDAVSGELLDWARRLCDEADELGLYREVTVSGCGLRFIGSAQGNELHRKFTFDRQSGAGVELYRNCARYITISGLQEGDCAELGSIDAYLDTLMARYDGQAPARNIFDFNDAGPQQEIPDYEELIENGSPEGERSEKFQSVVWRLAGQGRSAEEIAAELSKYPGGIGAKYAGRLLAEVKRSFGKWQRTRQAGVSSASTASAPVSSASSWPQIKVIAGELPRVVNEAEEALLLLGREIYQRGSTLVRPVLNKSLRTSDKKRTERWQLLEITRPYLVEQLCCAARFLQWDKRARKFVAIDAPDKVAEAYLNRQGSWRVPPLAGIVNTPFLRNDGSICETPGYDPESYLLFKTQTSFPPVPQSPGKGEALIALEKLDKLIATFPFVSKADRTAMLAAILTALDRRSMDTAPLIAFTTPVARTGKSKLVNIINILATGRDMPVLAQGKNDEEFEKRLNSALLKGALCISFDNCTRPVSADVLCQALTQEELDIRELGFSRTVGTATLPMIFVNGNNLVLVGDLTDRCLLISMDAEMERPGLRKFASDVIVETYTRRSELVIAALTVLRAWHVARARGERVAAESFGGFEDWSWRIREPLIWLGRPDPNDTIAKVRSNDPERDDLAAVLSQWKEHLGVGSAKTVQEAIDCAISVQPFHLALLNVAARSSGGFVSNDRLGRWLKRVEGRIVNGLRLVRAGIRSGYPIWSLRQ